MTLVVDYLRDEVGLPMGSRHFNTHIGWTTDATKRDRAVAAGANCTTVTTTATLRVIGYEITCGVGREMATQPQVSA